MKQYTVTTVSYLSLLKGHRLSLPSPLWMLADALREFLEHLEYPLVPPPKIPDF